MVLVRDRRAEQRENAIAGGLYDVAIVAMDSINHQLQRRIDNRPRLKVQVAVLTGYAATGGGFNNYLGALRSQGVIQGDGDKLRINEAGIQALGSWEPLPTGVGLIDYWRSRLGKAERLILETLTQVYPDPLTKEQVAANAGYEANGGGFNNALSRLRTLELVQGRGELRASDDLFGSASI
jgi:uncharacterized protein